ncbi:alpha-amylase [candidate division KSB1 bacterium]|nr:alpha-amylase [candidate division KSB1 bacterium]
MSKKIRFFVAIPVLIILVLFQFQQSFCHEPPEWAKKVVWYQIFPERFRNGDPDNDPQLQDMMGTWPFNDTSEFQIVPWTADWYKLQPWEKANKKGFYYNAQRRRFGGDLQGILNRLDYLQELGINAIYFNPLFESPSLHKYDATLHHHIDDNFGPDPEGDKKIMRSEIPDDPSTWKWTAADSLFLKLIDECHSRNIRVIIDGVFNHVGYNFFAFEDLRENQRDSKYAEWFTVKKWDNPETEKDEFEYESWANVKSMPEIREDEENGFVDDAWDYFKAVILRWMDPNGDGNPEDGIDGWRLDVAEKVTEASWRKFRTFTRSVNPESYLVGEVWWEDWPDKMFNAAPWLQGDMFDAVMNYRFAAAVTKFFINQEKKISASEFDAELATVREDYPQDVNYVLQNLMDSHDTDRLASMIMNPDRIYGHQNRVEANRDYDVTKPSAEHRKIQKLILLFQMTYIGAPMIFYGDEVGMWGASDPDERKPMLWADLTYEDETSHPFGKDREPDKNIVDQKLFDYYKKLIHIRRESKALQLGTYKTLTTEDERSLFIFKRNFENETVVTLINNSDSPQYVDIDLGAGDWKDVLTGQPVSTYNGEFSDTIPPKYGMVLVHNE